MTIKRFNQQTGTYHQLTDLEILEQLTSETSLLFSELLTRYYPLIRSIETRYPISGLEWDDWVQEASYVLWKAASSYSTSRRITFGAYYKRILINQRVDLLRASLAYKRQMDRIAYSLDIDPEFYENSLQDDKVVLPETKTLYNEAIQDYLAVQLSPFEREVLLKTFSHPTLEAVALNLKVPVRKVRSAYERAHKKAQRLLEH